MPPKTHFLDFQGRPVCGRRISRPQSYPTGITCKGCRKKQDMATETVRLTVPVGGGRFDEPLPPMTEFLHGSEWHKAPPDRPFGMLSFTTIRGNPEGWISALEIDCRWGCYLYIYQRPRPNDGFEYAALRSHSDVLRLRWGIEAEFVFEPPAQPTLRSPAPRTRSRRKKSVEKKPPLKKARARPKKVAKPSVTVYDHILGGGIIDD